VVASISVSGFFAWDEGGALVGAAVGGDDGVVPVELPGGVETEAGGVGVAGAQDARASAAAIKMVKIVIDLLILFISSTSNSN
jgi:hypothetical protein